MLDQNFVKNPSLQQLKFVVALWFIGSFLSVLASSNFFSESPFKMKYLMMGILIFAATLSASLVVFNYIKNKKLSK